MFYHHLKLGVFAHSEPLGTQKRSSCQKASARRDADEHPLSCGGSTHRSLQGSVITMKSSSLYPVGVSGAGTDNSSPSELTPQPKVVGVCRADVMPQGIRQQQCRVIPSMIPSAYKGVVWLQWMNHSSTLHVLS